MLTRSFLKGMQLNEEQISAIIEEHSETVNSLKAQRDSYKEAADELEQVKTELNDLKAHGDGGWQKKYEDEHAAFEQFKADQTKESQRQAKATAYRSVLKDAGVSDKAIDSVINATNFDGIEMDDNGKLKDVEGLSNKIKEKWSGFIVKEEKHGADIEHPPKTESGASMTKEEIMAIKDRTERRKAIAEHPEVFK